MPQKRNSTLPPADEPERKVTKIDGGNATKADSGLEASTIPDDRKLMTEVQMLLVGTDLATTNVGQLRKELEERLGLDAGALGASKSLRRKVGGVIHHEVVKKGLRNEDCERIAQALVEFEDYPADARRMLIESLPHAVPSNGQRPHAHQVQLLAIVHTALDSARGQLANALAGSKECTHEAEVELHRRERAKGTAAELEASAHTNVENSDGHFNDAKRQVETAEHELSAAEQALQILREEVAKSQKAKQNAIALREGPLQLLLSDLVGELNRDAVISEVVQYLEATGTDTALMASVQIMLQRPSSKHSAFDKITLNMLEQLLDEHINTANAQCALEAEVSMDANRLGAAALLNAARARSAEQAAACLNAKTALEAATAVFQASNVEVSEQQIIVNEKLADQARHESKLQKLDETITVLDRLMIIDETKTATFDEKPSDVVVEAEIIVGSPTAGNMDVENGSTGVVTVSEPISPTTTGLSDTAVDASIPQQNLVESPSHQSPCPSCVTLPAMSPNKMGAKKEEFDFLIPRFVSTPLSPNSRHAALAAQVLQCKDDHTNLITGAPSPRTRPKRTSRVLMPETQ